MRKEKNSDKEIDQIGSEDLENASGGLTLNAETVSAGGNMNIIEDHDITTTNNTTTTITEESNTLDLW